MEVLREYSQLVNKTNLVLGYDISQTPMLDEMNEDNLEYIANHSKLCEDKKLIGELSELVFQLNEYVPALVNYTKIFLYMQEYEAVKEFISKLYVGHIQNANYVSKAKQYNLSERLFDRFIEVVKVGKINVEQYMPLVLESIFEENSSLYIWRDAAMEYMQTFMRENENQIGDYIVQNSKYELEFLTLILAFNTQKGISILFNNKNHEKISESNAEQFLKTYITDTLAFFDKNLPTEPNRRFHYIKVLAGITNNVEVETRLENIYDNETNEEIKEFLAKRLGITETLNFGTDKHFKVLAQKKVTEVQERSLGVAFENMPLEFVSGDFANDVEKTYLINILKEEKNLLNLVSLNSLYQIFTKESLNQFAEKLFNKLSQKEDINAAKWCVRMFSLFSDGLFERTIYEFLVVLYKLNRRKEALYLTQCLLYSGKPNFLEMFVRLNKFDLFNQNYEEFVEIYASVTNKSIEEVKDLTLPAELDENGIQREVDRLYYNFVSGRKYSKDLFKKLFLYNPIYNNFAQRLVFGEYKQNKLYSVFLVSGKDLVYIYGTTLGNADKDVYISLVHQLDLDERFDKVDLTLQNPLFEQFKKTTVDIKDFNKSNMSVTNLYGTIVNGDHFVKSMQEKGFVPNVKDGEVQFNSLVMSNKMLNLLVEVGFQNPITIISPMATIGNIRFYRLSECMKDEQKYIPNKAQSLSLGGVNDRYFDYIVSSIHNSHRFN